MFGRDFTDNALTIYNICLKRKISFDSILINKLKHKL